MADMQTKESFVKDAVARIAIKATDPILFISQIGDELEKTPDLKEDAHRDMTRAVVGLIRTYCSVEYQHARTRKDAFETLVKKNKE